MTSGVLLFAQNNNEIDYVKIAKFSAEKIKQHLKVPVSVVTNQHINDSIFDKVIVVENTQQNTKQFKDGLDKTTKDYWNNTSRSNCFDLTPYENTLVLDVDYVVNSDKLSFCWNQPRDFLIYEDSYDLANWRTHQEFKFVSEYSIPFYWATVFFFRKTRVTQAFFNLVTHIKDNWFYYKLVYKIYSPNFRNDIAFSIAVHMMNGFSKDGFAGKLPGKLHYTLDIDYLVELKNDSMKFLVQQESYNYIALKTNSLDMHVMNKYSLLRAIDNV